MKTLFFSLLIILFIAQWAFPGSVLWSRKKVVDRGKVFKFRTEPVDPAHPFKGRYVRLNFSASECRTKQPGNLHYDQTVYATIRSGEDGYAVISAIYPKEPQNQTDYVEATIWQLNNWDDSTVTTIHVNFPFDEYYMEESRAPKTERLYNDSAFIGKPAYALVKLYKGRAVAEGLFIDDKPVEELVR